MWLIVINHVAALINSPTNLICDQIMHFSKELLSKLYN